MTTEAVETYAVIAGGGTAGHVHPGLAIADALVERGHPRASIHYVGSERGIERSLVPAEDYPLTLLPGRGIQRRLTAENIGAIWGLLKAIGQGVQLLRRLRPKVVVSLGGYASIPCALAAVALRIPIVVAEQNAVPGAANRLVGRWAKAAAVSFDGTDLPRRIVTGNPVRHEVLEIDTDADPALEKERFGVAADRRLVAVFGGSLGARRINRALLDACRAWADRSDLSIRHVIGRRDYDEVIAAVPVDEDAPLQYVPVSYEDRMPELYLAADLVVCRAGASSVAEIAVIGVPAVLVPLPGAPGDHQTANARALAEVGAAVTVPDDELTGDRLRTEVERLLADDDGLAAMAAAGRAVGRRDAADRVADLVEEHADD